MVNKPSPVVTTNRLLAALAPDALALLMPKLRRVTLANRQILYEAEQPIDAVYFVEAGMVSMVTYLDEGVMAEVGIIGREGMTGLPLLSGVETSFVESMVQLPGSALQMDVKAFKQELVENAPLRTLLLRFKEAIQAQISQTAACNGRYDLEQRLARWLLMAHDRVDGDSLPLTQEFMASMLGVHRPSITVTAGILQRAGLIRYAGGQIAVLDRPSLEQASCECYAAVRRRFESLLGMQTS